MTIQQQLICDRKGCPSQIGSRQAAVADTWFDLECAAGTVQFCSVPCLSAWLDAMPPAADPSPGVVFTCDQCEKEILLMPGNEWPTWVEMKREEQGAARVGFCSNSCLVLWVGHYADAHFTDTLSKKFLSEHAVKL